MPTPLLTQPTEASGVVPRTRFGRRALLTGVAALAAPFRAGAEEKAERINPCNTPDPGFGRYTHWFRGITMGQMIALESRGGVAKNGDFDLGLHFHGHDGARKEWIRVMNGPALFGVTLGLGSGVYESTFRDTSAFPALVESIEQAMAERAGRKSARARRIVLTAWSAGYGAVRSILSQQGARARIDSVILLDGLHCDYVGEGLERADLDPFLRYAREAAANKRLMVVSHSSIVPPGYASTTETANYLIRELGGKAQRARGRASDPLGMQLIARYDEGGFHVRGYTGKAEPDHCAHLTLFRDILKVHLLPRWNKGVAKKS
jgi:hypothetical protein